MFESNEPKSEGSKETQKMKDELNILPSEKVDIPWDYNSEVNLSVPLPKAPAFLSSDLSFDYPKNIWESLQSLNENLESKLQVLYQP